MSNAFKDQVHKSLADTPTPFSEIVLGLGQLEGAAEVRNVLLELQREGSAELVPGFGWKLAAKSITQAAAQDIAKRIVDENYPSEMGYDGLIGAIDEGALDADGVRAMLAAAAIAGSQASHA